MNSTRRDFLKHASVASLSFTGLSSLFERTAHAAVKADKIPSPFGEMRPEPQGILELPEGFSCKVLAKVGDPMSDGFFVPGKPDGMATFKADKNRTILICNHELNPGDIAVGPFSKDPALRKQLLDSQFYDAGSGGSPAMGGTSTLIHNTVTGEVEGHWLSLAGTIRNCAGWTYPLGQLDHL